MDETQKKMRIEKASELFHKGYNCAQSVAGAFAKDVGLNEQTMFKLSSSFGGGMGRTRGVCGAVSAMCIIAGLAKGYSSPDDAQAKTRHYALIQLLLGKFDSRFGSCVCKKLLDGLDAATSTSPVADQRNDKYYSERPCAAFVCFATSLVCDYVL